MNRLIFLILSCFVIMLYLNVPVYFGQKNSDIISFLNPPFLFLVLIYGILNIRKMRYPFLFIGLYFLLYFFALWSEVFVSGGGYFSNYTKVFIILLGMIIFYGVSFANNYKVMPIFIISALLATAFNILDFFFQGQFFQIFDGFGVRAAGFYVNSNNSAAAILLAMSLSTQSLPSKFRLLFVMFCLFGVALTLSRGGVIAWFMLYILFFIYKVLDLKSGLISAVALSIFASTIGLFFSYLSSIVNLSQYADRISFLQGEDAGQSATTDARYDLILMSLKLFEQSPFYGNGWYALLRNGSDQLSHNQYLAMLVDFGVLGFGIYVFMIYVIFRSKSDFMLTCIFVLIWGFFAHDILGQYAFLIAFACVSQFRTSNRQLLSI